MSGDARGVVVLLSGGMDSATTLAWARAQGMRPVALSFEYGQRHRAELQAAAALARAADCEHVVFPLDLSGFRAPSALLDSRIAVPDGPEDGIPATYVPARNTVFLAVALMLAEARGLRDLCIGVTAVDYSGYPDCRGEYLDAFRNLAQLATRAGAQGEQWRLHAPLLELSKADIIRLGAALGVDYAATVSCYRADDAGRACGRCEACRLRRQGFAAADAPDPTRYRAAARPEAVQ